MAAPPPFRDAGMPRWVKVSGIIAIVLLLLFVIHFLTGGGPGMHNMADVDAPTAGDQTP